MIDKEELELYYYTSVETMQFILQDANIFATNLLYMNDAEEYKNGLKELREIINDKFLHSHLFPKKMELISMEALENAQEEDVTRYSISFSTARDLLSQWSMYAGESGVSLKMRFTGEEKYKAYYGKEREDITNSVKYIPKKVFYCTRKAMKSDQYKAVADEIWNAIENSHKKATMDNIEENAPFIWQEMTPYVKRFEFSAEGEYRLVFDWTKLIKPFRIDYRVDKHVLKPYLDIECQGGWPICEIIVGPGFNQNVVFDSILHFLNYRKIQVKGLSDADFCVRCREYFAVDGKMPGEVQEIWDSMKEKILKAGKDKRYDEFVKVRKTILKMSGLRTSYKENLCSRQLSKEGIILSKSGIPYIF